MSLPQQIDKRTGKRTSPSNLREPLKNSNIKLPYYLLIFIVLVLIIEGGYYFFLTRRKGELVAEKKIVEEARLITPEPTIEKESSWGGRKTYLIQGTVSSFDPNKQTVELILKNQSTKEVEIDDKTEFSYIELDTKQTPSFPKTVPVSIFWAELKEGDKVSFSCYEGSNIAVFVTKEITY